MGQIGYVCNVPMNIVFNLKTSQKNINLGSVSYTYLARMQHAGCACLMTRLISSSPEDLADGLQFGKRSDTVSRIL